MKSMTGFGVGEAPLGDGRVVVELRGVNGRFLDVRVKTPREAQDHASAVELVVRQALVRGRVEALVRFEGATPTTVRLDDVRAAGVLAQLVALRDRLAPGEPVPISVLAAVPDLFAVATAPEHAATRDALETATRRALAAFDEMRTREGRALAEELEARIDAMEGAAAAVRARVPDVVASYRRRLCERITALLTGSGIALDPQRLEQEVVVFADRCDVTEELVRLSCHAAQLRTLCADDADGTGRRLDFLLQEMAREANTIGSKTADAETTRLVVDLKAEIERMREQAQNVS